MRTEDGWIRVTASCRIPVSDLEWRVSRSGGPGGQHANTSDSKVEVRFPVATSSALGPRQRARLLERFGPVASAIASDSRSQARNRDLALERLVSKLATGLRIEAPRRPTRPSRSSGEARLRAKRERSERKQARRRPDARDD